VVLDFLYVAFFLAILGIYVARTYKDVVQRPLSVVDWKHSTLPQSSHVPATERD
jgi:hypothetical protein